ncbi:LysR family transcriptional regulator [Acidisoma silvae]|uniref:LysR family transcriptional regulator n=1 Tax=Acidisoma silvae TaxID=2802396 RepID=A0A963YW09_9PROT|nr:LysR family transcriptional regulator [Acidisoma silvae]MCB8877884.1 LysR family transcriptional regulator [Acidisoma silvae]
MSDLAAIGTFVAVGDRGGFRAAAATLGMTSSGVSKAVSRLERSLGVQLLARTTRVVRLTPAGATFHARCKAILADLADAESVTAAAAVLPSGKLTISVAATGIEGNRVMPVVAAFLERHPQVEVEARMSDRFVDFVEENVDLAIRIGHLPASDLIAVKVGESRLALCGAPRYLAAAGVPVHPDDLAAHRFVGFVTPGTATRFKYRFAVDGQLRAIDVSAQLVVDDGDALVAAALQSVGLIMVSDHVVADLIRQGRLVRLLRDFEAPATPISVVHPPSRHLSPAARILIDMLRQGMHSAG